MDEQKTGMGTRLKSFILQCTRVWHVLKKPTGVEFKTVAKVSAIGILLIGAIGFIVADAIKIIGSIFT